MVSSMQVLPILECACVRLLFENGSEKSRDIRKRGEHERKEILELVLGKLKIKYSFNPPQPRSLDGALLSAE